MKTTEQLKAGMRVKVDAHGQHEEDFSGIIEGVDNDNYLVHVRAPDGELYGCTMAFVLEWPEEYAPVAHTSGPWRPFFRYVLANGRFLATAHAVGDKGNGAGFHEGQEPTQDANEAETNARLIAAAPELLAACRMALDSLLEATSKLQGMGLVPNPPKPDALIPVLRAAIAKAEGGAS